MMGQPIFSLYSEFPEFSVHDILTTSKNVGNCDNYSLEILVWIFQVLSHYFTNSSHDAIGALGIFRYGVNTHQY